MRNYNDYAIVTFLRTEFAHIPAGGGGRLLDLGCGSRPYAGLYRERFSYCIAGDFDVRTSNLDVRLDAQSLPFTDESFDLILFSEVVEHLGDSRKALAEVGRVLKPGGITLITWPFNYMLHELPHDYVRYSEYGMAKLLAEVGLEIETIARRGSAFALGFVICQFLLENVFEAVVRSPVIGQLFKPIRRALLWLLVEVPYQAYFAFRGNATLRYQTGPGKELRGWRGQLFHWTLGYCARVRKAG
jgi:ubiquinone/menaquinone biosynthesis C-methylase UbiE